MQPEMDEMEHGQIGCCFSDFHSYFPIFPATLVELFVVVCLDERKKVDWGEFGGDMKS